MAPLIYTASQLLALRPPYKGQVSGPITPALALSPLGATYFSLWRKYNRLIKDGPKRGLLQNKPLYREVMRFSFAESNKAFRRRYIRTYGTLKGINSLPRFPVKELSVRVQFLERYFKEAENLLILLDRLRSRFRTPVQRSQFAKTTHVFGKDRKGKTSRVEALSKPKYKDGAVARVHSDSHGRRYATVAGGLTYSLDENFKPPPKGKDKYWYFYRTRGRWKASEHHPYGDEYMYLNM